MIYFPLTRAFSVLIESPEKLYLFVFTYVSRNRFPLSGDML
ncbi:hypothetical protein CES86_3591 [Brucella lupini]|uniref:Uncharacterized protein n=1 Tax=Brucella lupini TaxID=255457 RepID=A0A256GHR6_9HYPH|nr:hypothetical protein CES86_3591 [Brucella lupini]